MKKIKIISFTFLFLMMSMLLFPQIAKAFIWEQANVDDFGDSNNDGYYCGGVTFGDYAYVSTDNSTTGTELFRTDGTGAVPLTWNQVNSDGFDASGGANEYCELNTFLIVNISGTDYLYIGTKNSSTGGELWRSSDGTTWNQVNSDGFTQPLNTSIRSLEEFNGYIYAGVDNTNGAQVWRCQISTGCNEQSDWSDIDALTAGFAPSTDERIVLDLQAFGSYLYAATRYDNGAGTNYGRIYRCLDSLGCDDDADWTLVGGNGFGDDDNEYTYTLRVFDGEIYASTSNFNDGGELWKSSDGSSWSSVITGGVGSANDIELFVDSTYGGNFFMGTTNYSGASLWYSADGSNWSPASDVGFGDVSNIVLNSGDIELDGYFYAMAIDSAGGVEVWRTDGSEPAIPEFTSKLAAIIIGISALGLFGLIVLTRGKRRKK